MSDTRTEIKRIKSHLGDVILQHDDVRRDGTIKAREIIMFVPTAEIPDLEEGNDE